MDEFRRVVWDCDSSKAPRPDGFIFNFYKIAWPLIGEELFRVVSEFFIIEKLPKSVNTSYVTLVPKNTHPTKFMEFIPISLIHDM